MLKTCKQCTAEFEITDEDLKFYDKVSPVFDGKKLLIPPPTFCPDCRRIRRMAWRNIRSLYKRKCDLCAKEMLSNFSPDKKYVVYCRDCYYGDKWDPFKYGRDFDFSRPFFEQFDKLLKEVPTQSLDIKLDNENCDFNNYVAGNKNCYLIFAASFNEDSFYSMYLQRSKDVLDCYFVFDCELCYECIDCYNCYHLQYSQDCQTCSNSLFLYDCHGCKNCFGCVSLINKEFCLFNEQLSEDDYKKKVAELVATKDLLSNARKRFEKLRDSVPHKYYSGVSNQSVTGDHISFSKNSYNCFDCTYLEDSKYCTWFHQAKTCYDCHGWGLTAELDYEVHLTGMGSYNVRFSESCWDSVSDLLYCRFCLYSCSHLFGCVALRRQKYCIFNKQYSKEEYEKLMPRIIEHMIESGEWGEFFPVNMSPFGFNESEGYRFFPMTKETAINIGLNWKDDEQKVKSTAPEIVIPYNILEVNDDIVGNELKCSDCGKGYKIISQEYKFYKKMYLPIPGKCHDCRYKKRVMMRSGRKLYDRKCDKCGDSIKTTYLPDCLETVYCEKCYLKEVY